MNSDIISTPPDFAAREAKRKTYDAASRERLARNDAAHFDTMDKCIGRVSINKWLVIAFAGGSPDA